MKPFPMNDPLAISRRYFVERCSGLSLGAVALGALNREAGAAPGARGGEVPSLLGLADLPHLSLIHI